MKATESTKEDQPRISRTVIDPVGLFGVLGAATLISASITLTAADANAFLNWPGLVIVLGGVTCATLISYPGHQLRRFFPALARALQPNRRNVADDLDQIVRVAGVWQKGDFKAIERETGKVKSQILRIGIEWSLAGTPIRQVQAMMEWEHERQQLRDEADAEILRTMAGYSPAFGMLGTLLGLINLLYDLDEAGIEEIGANMAMALITTFYGLLCANLFFMPLSVKLQTYFSERSRDRRMAIEAVRLLHSHTGPAQLRETLNGIAFGENALSTGEVAQ